jgi:hypothetical protein
MNTNQICIFCKNDSSENISIEHIIPEALGCPKGFVLSRGEVCKGCNSSLAYLDKAVIDDFDFFMFTQGIPRKRNRLPQILSRGNVVGYHKGNEKIIYFNLDKKVKINVNGYSVSPIGKSERNIAAKFKDNTVSFQTKVGADPKFARGIQKIAFSSIVYFIGSELFLGNEYDPIRDFIINGKGDRKIILLPADNKEYVNEVRPLVFDSDSKGEYGIMLRLGWLVFLVDLSPQMRYFPIFKKQAEILWGQKGWTYLPVDVAR